MIPSPAVHNLAAVRPIASFWGRRRWIFSWNGTPSRWPGLAAPGRRDLLAALRQLGPAANARDQAGPDQPLQVAANGRRRASTVFSRSWNEMKPRCPRHSRISFSRSAECMVRPRCHAKGVLWRHRGRNSINFAQTIPVPGASSRRSRALFRHGSRSRGMPRSDRWPRPLPSAPAPGSGRHRYGNRPADTWKAIMTSFDSCAS